MIGYSRAMESSFRFAAQLFLTGNKGGGGEILKRECHTSATHFAAALSHEEKLDTLPCYLWIESGTISIEAYISWPLHYSKRVATASKHSPEARRDSTGPMFN
jgi:hypothetical protein